MLKQRLNSSRLWKICGVCFCVSGCTSATSRSFALLPSTYPATKSTKNFVNSIGMTFNYLPGGSFLMGDTQDSLAQPVHKVTLSGFWMGRYEVTNEEFEHFQNWGRPPESLTSRQPASRVSWQEAANFCRWLSRKEGKKYRLPTEAEWEYAARGGLQQKMYPWGDEDWQGRATWQVIQTSPVGTHAPNGYGLYDMAGNVEEWVSDWDSDNYYAHSPAKDPKGPPRNKYEMKVVRDGRYTAWDKHCGGRSQGDPYQRSNPAEVNDPDKNWGLGFRIVMSQ